MPPAFVADAALRAASGQVRPAIPRRPAAGGPKAGAGTSSSHGPGTPGSWQAQGALAAAAAGLRGVGRHTRRRRIRRRPAAAALREEATAPAHAARAVPARRFQSVQRCVIGPEAVAGFHQDFFSSTAGREDDEFLWNALEDPVGTEQAMCRSYKRAVRWLPQDVLSALLRFFADPAAAPALWVSGLPIDPEVPPTPALPGDYRLPICESWLLGIGRILGVPSGMLGFYTSNARGGLVRDLVPKPGLGGINNPHIHLSFHRDVPANISGAETEPDGFLLLAARGDPEHRARTLVCSNRAIAAGLSPEELTALRRSPVRTECVRVASGAVSAYGLPFHAVEGPEEDPKATLFYIPQHREFEHRVVSDDPEAAAAYKRAVAVAAEECEEVDLQAGDLLVINNARCNHARTAFKPRLDGSDRWLLKTFVQAAGWQRPSQLGGVAAPLRWPNTLVRS
mmetsp:Transcript_61861/g.199481  ORF Transcript_61861/g.199481 Transcript_61861/m.199481 type:complete len:453 (-) Transcript_61861:5-1363(-)